MHAAPVRNTWDNRELPSPALLGAPVVTSTTVPVGDIYLTTSGIGPMTVIVGVEDLTEHQADARRIVRQGLCDVLAWLGEPVEPLTAGGRFIAKLRGAAAPAAGGCRDDLA